MESLSVAYAENFHGGFLGKDHMVVICIWFALLVTSQFDVVLVVLFLRWFWPVLTIPE